MAHRTKGHQPRSWLALLVVTLLVAGCGSTATTPSPSGTAAPLPSTGAPLVPSGVPTSTPLANIFPTLAPRPTEAPAAGPTELVTPQPTEEPTPQPTETPAPTATPGPTTPRPTSGPDLASSGLARAPADPAEATTAAASIDAFGLDLFRQLLADGTVPADRNAVVSPTSIALALGMALPGAKGETATQMDAVLHTSGWEALGPGLNSLSQALAARDATWEDYSGQHALALRIANAAYGQRGWTIERGYLDAIAAAFGAGLRLVDYQRDFEAARQVINAWVSEQTKARIPELIPSGPLNALTRLVLVNAIYLKAEWEIPFSEADTGPAPFARPDGSKVDVPTMTALEELPYARGTGWQATELRYLGPDGPSQLAMTLVLPDDLAAFRKGLTAIQVTRITTALAEQREMAKPAVQCPYDSVVPRPRGYRVKLYLPRFGIDTGAPLQGPLKGLGMALPFARGTADFSGIHVPKDPEERLYIGDVIHQANIDVDEKGTEAAAATAVVMQATGGGCEDTYAKTITLRLDRPFLFFVRDVETGAVLFMGQVTDPSVEKGS